MGDSGDGGDSDFRIPRRCHPYGRTPCKRKMQAWDSPALFGRVKPPLRSEKSFRFFRLRLQGVTHYTLPCKEPCARRSLWTPLRQGCALLSCALRLRIKEWRHDGDGSYEGVSPKYRHHRHDRHAGNKDDSCGSRQGVSQNCCHRRHRCHPKGSYPPKKGR